MDLNRCGRDLHRYVTTLENTLIETCARFGVQDVYKRQGPEIRRPGCIH